MNINDPESRRNALFHEWQTVVHSAEAERGEAYRKERAVDMSNEQKTEKQKIDELKSAAREALPIIHTTIEFKEYSSEEWHVYLRLKKALEEV